MLFLAPFLLVLYYGSVSHELGHLAQKFCDERYEPELSLEVKESAKPILLIDTNKESTMATEISLFTLLKVILKITSILTDERENESIGDLLFLILSFRLY